MTLTNKLAPLALVALLAGCAAPAPTGKAATVPAGVPAIESSIALAWIIHEQHKLLVGCVNDAPPGWCVTNAPYDVSATLGAYDQVPFVTSSSPRQAGIQ